MRFLRGVERTNVAAISACVMMTIAGALGCGGGSSTNPAPSVSVALTPATASVQADKTASFTATVSNDPKNDGTTWTLSGPGCTGAACGTLSGNTVAANTPVMYTAPAAVPNPPTVTITATAVDDTTKSAKATITLTAGTGGSAISVVVTPTTASVAVGATQAFAATLQNDSANKGVNWTLSGTSCTGSACGTVSPASSTSGVSVTYTAPSAIPTGTVTLTATSVADGTKSASAGITLTGAPPIVSVTPSTANIATGGVTQTFTANVSNDPQNLGVTWSVTGTNCTGAACGSFSPTTSASGAAVTYTSAARATAAGTVTITAASVAEASAVGTAAVTLAAPAAPTTNPMLSFTGVAVDAGFGVPAIATDSSGNIDLAWMNFDGIHVMRSTNGGANFSNPVLVPSDLSLNIQDNVLDMVIDPVGDIDLLWSRAIGPGGATIVFDISRSSDNGTTFTTPLQFTTRPNIAGRSDGKLILISADGSSNLIAESTSDGVHLSAPTTIATAVPGLAGVQVVVGPEGHVYVFWETSTAASSCSISFSSSADAVVYTAAKTISGGAGACNSQPAASVDANGNIDVTWVADSTNLFFTRSTDDGANFSIPINIATPANPTANQVVAGSDGGIYVLWTAGASAMFANSQNGGASFNTNATPLGFSLGSGPPSFVVDACGNVTAFGSTSPADSTYQRSNDGGVTFAPPVDITVMHQDFEQQLAADKSGNVNLTWAAESPGQIDFARLPTVCHVQ